MKHATFNNITDIISIIEKKEYPYEEYEKFKSKYIETLDTENSKRIVENIKRRVKGVQSEKVSIIVPVYNVEKYLKRCLNSLVNQTLTDIEVILVNDGSKDKSQEIINEFKEKYPEK